MDHPEHVRLLAGGVPPAAGVWADFGAGSGAFTLALRDLAGPAAEIYAVDSDSRALAALQEAMQRHFPGTALHLVPGNFTRPLRLPALDGAVAANSLHFLPVAEQVRVLRCWREHLSPGGRLVLVEYDSDEGNRWIPYPISLSRLATLAEAAGYSPPEYLAEHPSRMLTRIYSALLTIGG